MTEREQISIPETPVLVLSGGEGTRLKRITRGDIPKALVEIFPEVTFLDQLLQGLESAGFENYIFCLGYRHEQIIKHLYQKWPNIHKASQFSIEERLLGTAGAISLAIREHNITVPFLVIPSDAVFPYHNIYLLFEDFKRRSFAWATTKVVFPEDKEHFCLLTDEYTKTIIGNSMSEWFNKAHLDEVKQKNIQVKTFFDGGHGLLDPVLFLEQFWTFSRLCGKKERVCLYKDILPMMAEQNRRKLIRNQLPTLHSVDVIGAVIDMGTPVRLERARDWLRCDFFPAHFADRELGGEQENLIRSIFEKFSRRGWIKNRT